MLIHPLVSLVRLVGAGVASMACWVEATITTDVVMRVVGVVIGLIACWVEGTPTDVVDGVTDGHTSSISCTTVPAVRDVLL